MLVYRVVQKSLFKRIKICDAESGRHLRDIVFHN